MTKKNVRYNMQVKKDLGLHGTRGHEHKRKENPGSIDFASKDT